MPPPSWLCYCLKGLNSFRVVPPRFWECSCVSMACRRAAGWTANRCFVASSECSRREAGARRFLRRKRVGLGPGMFFLFEVCFLL